MLAVAGKEYGTGSSRDWVVKGIRLLGIKGYCREFWENHSQPGMGVLPLEMESDTSKSKLKGTETFDIEILKRFHLSNLERQLKLITKFI